MSITKIFVRKNFKKARAALQSAMINADKDMAGEIALAQMEEAFNEANAEYSEAKARYKKEQGDVVEKERVYDERYAKAEKLQSKIDSGDTNPALATALNGLLDLLDTTAEEIENEKEEAADALLEMKEMKEDLDAAGEKLRSGRSTVKKATAEMKKAERDIQRNKDKEERARRRAGLESNGGVDSVLDAMNENTRKMKSRAEEAARKADLLAPTNVEDDIDALLAEDNEPAVRPSASDRLAKMKRR